MTDDIDLPQVPNCVVHGTRDSVDNCSRCGNPFCSECLVILEGVDLCRLCVKDRDSELKGMRSDTQRKLREKQSDLERAEKMGATIAKETLDRLRQDVAFLDRRAKQLDRILAEITSFGIQ